MHRRAEVVGVFVNAGLDEGAAAADRAGLSMLQLHGDEGPAYCAEAARRTGCKVMKAVRVKDAAQVRGLRAFHTDYHLLDAYVPRTPGGTGETFNWELARLHDGPAEVVLSGGLTPDNVGEAIETARPFAVDTASGTEASPGKKDPGLVEDFFRAVERVRAAA
jgi:phosphoribosylanthranilate isomerase